MCVCVRARARAVVVSITECSSGCVVSRVKHLFFRQLRHAVTVYCYYLLRNNSFYVRQIRVWWSHPPGLGYQNTSAKGIKPPFVSEGDQTTVCVRNMQGRRLRMESFRALKFRGEEIRRKRNDKSVAVAAGCLYWVSREQTDRHSAPLPPAQRAATLSSTSHFVVGHRDGESDFIPSFLLALFLSLFSFIYSPFLSFFSRFCFYCWGSSFSLLFPLFFPILNFVVVVLFVFVFFVSLWLVCRCVVVVVVVSLLPVVLYCFHVVDTNTSNENFGRFTWLMPQTRCRSVSAIF